MAVAHEQREAARYTRSGSIVTATRRFLIDGLTGPLDARPAEAEIATGLPRQGDALPGEPSARAYSIETYSFPGRRDRFQAEVRYSSDPAASGVLSTSDPVEYGYRAITTQEVVIEDVNGAQLKTIWTNNQTTTITTTTRVTLERPAVVLDITRTTDIDPITLNATYGGKVNSDVWGPYQPDQVRCEQFVGSSTDGDSLWRVTGTFLPSPAARGDWKVEVVALEGGVVPDGVSIGDGISVFDVYESVAFGASGFVLP